MKPNGAQNQRETAGPQSAQWLEVVLREAGSLRFGVVQITVHDSTVVQVEKTEKIRFQPPQPAFLEK